MLGLAALAQGGEKLRRLFVHDKGDGRGGHDSQQVGHQALVKAREALVPARKDQRTAMKGAQPGTSEKEYLFARCFII